MSGGMMSLKIKTRLVNITGDNYGYEIKNIKDKYLISNICEIINENRLISDLEIAYPWCFVLVSEPKEKRGYFVGSFLVREHDNKKEVVLSYAKVQRNWILKDFNSESTLPFWLSRILNIEQIGSHIYIENEQKKWLSALQFYYRPFLESILLTNKFRFMQRSHCLLEVNSQADLFITEDDGISLMPWKNWPACTQAYPACWLWRQSRFKKILESRLLIRHKASDVFI